MRTLKELELWRKRYETLLPRHRQNPKGRDRLMRELGLVRRRIKVLRRRAASR